MRDRFAMLAKPEAAYHGVVYTEQYGRAAYAARCRTVCMRNTGSVLAPMSAFLLLQGTETLALRVERHVENTAKVVAFLENHPQVAWCESIGRAGTPNHALAKKYLKGSGGPFLTFGVKGGFEEGKRFYDALTLFKRLVNIGDAKSLACHPASTTHRQLTPEELARVGVKPEMIRLCIGIEHIDDILADLEQALAATGVSESLSAQRAAAAACGVTVMRMDTGMHNLLVKPRGGWMNGHPPGALNIGLLNNMADSALESTERQFLRLLGAAAPELPIRWHLFSLRSIARNESGNLHLIHQNYGSPGDLYNTRLDAVIVTGAEPLQQDLRQEAYWPELATVFDWIDREGPPAIFSCLAAHAAVLHFDGIERRRLAQKRFGLFDHVVHRGASPDVIAGRADQGSAFAME